MLEEVKEKSNASKKMSLGERISAAGKRMEEPKHRISFKDAVKKFKSKEELYYTLAYRGKLGILQRRRRVGGELGGAS